MKYTTMIPADPMTKKERKAEQAAFAAYRASEEAKKFKVRDKFGFSRYATLEEAQAFAATLGDDAEIIYEGGDI